MHQSNITRGDEGKILVVERKVFIDQVASYLKYVLVKVRHHPCHMREPVFGNLVNLIQGYTHQIIQFNQSIRFSKESRLPVPPPLIYFTLHGRILRVWYYQSLRGSRLKTWGITGNAYSGVAKGSSNGRHGQSKPKPNLVSSCPATGCPYHDAQAKETSALLDLAGSV